jgi:hypothetical protein
MDSPQLSKRLDNVQVLDLSMGLQNKVDAVLTEENRVIKVLEDFKKEKKDILENVKDAIENNESGESFLKAKEDLTKIEININKCRYWNRGLCKEGSSCECPSPCREARVRRPMPGARGRPGVH